MKNFILDGILDFGLHVAKSRFTLLFLLVKVGIEAQFIWCYLPKLCSVGLGLPKKPGLIERSEGKGVHGTRM